MKKEALEQLQKYIDQLYVDRMNAEKAGDTEHVEAIQASITRDEKARDLLRKSNLKKADPLQRFSMAQYTMGVTLLTPIYYLIRNGVKLWTWRASSASGVYTVVLTF